MGAHPSFFPGGGDVADPELRRHVRGGLAAALGRPRHDEQRLRAGPPVAGRAAVSATASSSTAIDAGRDQGDVHRRIRSPASEPQLDPALVAALAKLEFLVVVDHYADSPLAPTRACRPAAGDVPREGRHLHQLRPHGPARSRRGPADGRSPQRRRDRLRAWRSRMGYGLAATHPAQIMPEIARLVPGYGGVTYARLERGGISSTPGRRTHSMDAEARRSLSPTAAHDGRIASPGCVRRSLVVDRLRLRQLPKGTVHVR